MGMFRRTDRSDEYRGLLTQGGSGGSALFEGSEVVGKYAMLRWATERARVGFGYSDRYDDDPSLLLHTLQRVRGDQIHQSYAAIVVIRDSGYEIDGPEPHAIDLWDGGHSQRYTPSWRQLSGFLDTDVPWWHRTLRDQRSILEWAPGKPPAVIPARDGIMRPEPLTALAADEPDGSHAAAVCLWLARDLRHRAAEEAHEFLARLDDEVDPGFRGFVVAAVPAALRRPAPDELPEVVRRDGWNAVINRRDTLAYQVAEISDQSMERNDWPVGQPTEVSPERCPVAAEFVDRLEYASTDDPPTALEHILLSYGNRHHVGTLLHDPQTELPALRRHPSDDSPSVVFVTPPDRLPSLEPLESVILSDGFAWIRTADGRLWPAPQLVGAGLAYGYRGSGPTTLAVLLERLLDDITAPAVPLAGGEPSPGLLELARQVPEDKTTVLTRDQLEHARLEQ